MNKKRIILAAVLLIGISVVFGVLQQKRKLIVVKTNPTNGAVHNPFLPITITFNRALSTNEVSITMIPNSTTKTVVSASVLNISPTFSFEPNTTYTVTVQTNPPHTFTFVTEQQGSNVPGWNEQMRIADQEYEAKHGAQDRALISLKSRVPIQENGFSIDFSYKTNTYTVTLAAPYSQNKTAFLDWIKKLGVTDLSTVRIIYTNK